MGTATKTKLTQVKVSVDPVIADAFKKACAVANVSMAAELSRFMAGYSNGLVKHKAAPDYSTRRQRRRAIVTMIRQMEQMMAVEERILDNTPENLQDSSAYEATEEAISSLEAAVDALSDYWMVP
jgi:hypothetical protein